MVTSVNLVKQLRKIQHQAQAFGRYYSILSLITIERRYVNLTEEAYNTVRNMLIESSVSD